MTFYYTAEVNVAYLTRRMRRPAVRRALIRVLQVVSVISVGLGAVNTGGGAWGLADIGVGVMAWLNVVGILFLHGVTVKVLRDYFAQKRAGIEPQFDPRPLGIHGADFWETFADQRAAVEAAGGARARPGWGEDVTTGELHAMINEVESSGELSEHHRVGDGGSDEADPSRRED